MKKINLVLSVIVILLVLFTNQAFSEIEINTLENQVIDTDSENILINKYDISDDYLVSSKLSTLNICSCAPRTNTITIFNTGKIPNTYQIKTNLEYASVTQSIIRLGPQESKDIIIYINTPCEKVDKELEVTVRSSTGNEKTLIQNLVSDFCTSFAVAKSDTIKNYQPCELQVHEFTVFNTADFKDTYYFSTDKFEKEITFSEKALTLLPYQNKTVFAYFSPDCSLYGNDDIKITTESEKTPLTSEITIFSSIIRNYPFFTTTPVEINQCNMRYDFYPIEIYNNAFIENDYELEINGPKWATISKEKITVPKNSKNEFLLKLAPTVKELGTYNLNITFRSNLGDFEIQNEIKVNVEDCYSFEVKPQYEKTLLTCSDDELTYFEIENTGSKTNNYSLWLDYTDKKEIVSLDRYMVSLFPGQTKKVYVILNLSDEKSREKITFYANTFSNEFTEKTVQKLKVLPTQECYKTDSNIASKYVFGRNESIVIIDITNDGFKKAIYDLKSNLDWITLNKDSLKLNPDETKNLTLTFTPNKNVKDDTYKAALNLKFEDLYDESYNYKVKIRNQTLWEKIKEYFSPEPTVPKIECEDQLNSSLCDNKYAEFGENEKLIINLSQYFYDPDGDELTYGVVNNTPNLKVKLDEGIATIKSINNWYGIGEIIFFASDEENTTYSDVFYVQAIDEPDNHIRIAIGKYWLILLLILLVIIFFLIVLVLKSDNEKVHYEPAPIIIETTKARKNDEDSKESEKKSVNVLVPVKKSVKRKNSSKRKKVNASKESEKKSVNVLVPVKKSVKRKTYTKRKKAATSKPAVKSSKTSNSKKRKVSTRKPTTKKPVTEVVKVTPRKTNNISPKKITRKITRRTIVEEIQEDEAQN